MKKRILSFLLVLVMLVSLVPTAFASNAYYINGKTVHWDDYSSSPNECWVYANNIYKKIWGQNFSNSFSDSNNSLRNLNDSELTLTAAHLKSYVSNAALGSSLRICNSEYLHGTDGWGHSQIIVQKDSNGFTVFEGGLSSYPYCREKYYTWSDYISTGWLGGTYKYIKYIKWPGAGAYTNYHTVTFNANGGSCSTGSVQVPHGGSISNPPTASRSGYTFDGWYTSASGGTWISPTFTFESDATVYAHWKVKRVAVSLYYPNGIDSKYIPVDVGSEYIIPSEYPLASGKYFCGWAYKSGATSYDLRPGDKITVTKDIDLYPVYVSHDKAVSGAEVYIYNIKDFDATGYNVQTVKHAKEIKIDKSYWTAWSDYSLDPVSASSTVEVRTAKMYRYYYYLCPYCGRHEPFYGTSDCGKQIPSSAWHIKWSTTPYSQVSSSTFSYASYKSYTYSLDGELWCFSTGNKNATAVGTIDADGAATVIETGYSYRTYVTKYDTQITYVNSYKITPNHTHNYSTAVTRPTCTTQGYTTYTCSCGDSYKSDYTDPLGHNYGGNGICSVCGDKDPDFKQPSFFSSLLDSIRSIFKNLFSWLPFC